MLRFLKQEVACRLEFYRMKFTTIKLLPSPLLARGTSSAVTIFYIFIVLSETALRIHCSSAVPFLKSLYCYNTGENIHTKKHHCNFKILRTFELGYKIIPRLGSIQSKLPHIWKKILQVHINAFTRYDVFQVYFVLVRIWDLDKCIGFFKHNSNTQKLLLCKT